MSKIVDYLKTTSIYLMDNKILNIKNILIAMIYFFPISFLFGNFFINLNLILSSILFCIYFTNRKNIKFISIEVLLLIIFLITNIFFDILLERENYIKTFGLIRFFIFGFLISYFFSNNILNIKKYEFYIACCIFIVCVDALFQNVFGFNLIGIKRELDFTSGFFGEEKILGSYISKILIFILPLLLLKPNLKKIFLLLLILVVILNTTERMGLFTYLVSITIFFLFTDKNFQKKIITIIASILLILTMIFLIENLRNNYLIKTLHQYGFENLNKKIIKTFNTKDNLRNCKKLELNKYECTEKYYEDLVEELGLIKLNTKGGFKILSNNHIAHILVALKIWNENKIVGIGVNNFRYFSYDKKYILKDELYNSLKASTHPHNVYIQVLVETGILGFILFFTSIIIIIKKRIKYLFGSKSIKMSEVAFLIMLIITLIPLPSGNIFGTSYGAFFWIFIFLNINFKNKKSKFLK